LGLEELSGVPPTLLGLLWGSSEVRRKEKKKKRYRSLGKRYSEG